MTNMRRYKIPVVFEFAGEFSIEASSLSVAKQYALQHFGLTIGTVHSTLQPIRLTGVFPANTTKKVGKGCRCEEPVTDQE